MNEKISGCVMLILLALIFLLLFGIFYYLVSSLSGLGIV